MLGRRKEVFYLMMHSTHLLTVIWKEGSVLFNDALNTFRYGYMLGRKEGSVLFNDALNTFRYGYMEGRKEVFYLTMHSTHLDTVMLGRKEVFYLTMHSTHLDTVIC